MHNAKSVGIYTTSYDMAQGYGHPRDEGQVHGTRILRGHVIYFMTRPISNANFNKFANCVFNNVNNHKCFTVLDMPFSAFFT